MFRWIFLLWLALLVPCTAQSITLWQGEARHQVESGDQIWLDRVPFTMLLTAAPDQVLRLTAGPAPGPKNQDSFGEARGMATALGPYPGWFLDWEGHHYLFHKLDGDSRLHLWKSLGPNRKVFYWHIRECSSWQGGKMLALPWDQVPRLEVRLQHPDGEVTAFRINWRHHR